MPPSDPRIEASRPPAPHDGRCGTAPPICPACGSVRTQVIVESIVARTRDEGTHVVGCGACGVRSFQYDTRLICETCDQLVSDVNERLAARYTAHGGPFDPDPGTCPGCGHRGAATPVAFPVGCPRCGTGFRVPQEVVPRGSSLTARCPKDGCHHLVTVPGTVWCPDCGLNLRGQREITALVQAANATNATGNGAGPSLRPAVPPPANSDINTDAIVAALVESVLPTRREPPSPERAVLRLGHLAATHYEYRSRTREYQVSTHTLTRPKEGRAERRFRCSTCQAEFAVDLPSLAALPAIRRRYRTIGLAMMAIGVLLPLGAWLVGNGVACPLLLGATIFACGIAPMAPMAQYRVKLHRVGDPTNQAQRAQHKLMTRRK